MVQITFKTTIRFKGNRFDFNNNLRSHDCARYQFLQIFRENMTRAVEFASLKDSRVEVSNIEIEFTGEKPNNKGVYT